MPGVQAKKNPKRDQRALQAIIAQQEAERRASAQSLPPVAPSPGSGVAIVPQEQKATPTLLPDDAVLAMRGSLGAIEHSLVEKRLGLRQALELQGITVVTFVTALDASQELRQWYRSVKTAQALLDVEEVGGIIADLDRAAAANDPSNPSEFIENGQRNAIIQAGRLKLEQIRWAGQRLLPSLFGEKKEIAGKVEIVVRREVKKIGQQAAE